MEQDNMRVYEKIGDARLLNIEIILDDENKIYSGKIENAPEQIKNLKYSKIEMTIPMKYYVYSKYN